MFKPNRVGTPKILGNTVVTSSTAYTFSNGNLFQEMRGNAVNAAAVGDFGFSYVRIDTPGTINANERGHIIQQVTVTEPLNGDAVGLELIGHFTPVVSAIGLRIAPVLFKAAAPAATLMGQVLGTSNPGILLKEGRDHISGLQHHYCEQALIQGAPVAGTYCHGFELFNTTGAAITLTRFEASFGVRQLNDQQNIGYRDTRI